jgi:WD40 repeat protein
LPHCIAFESSSGDILAVGFLNGDVKIMDVESLEDIVSFAPCADAILFLKFSPSGSHLAGYDSKSHTLLFKR